MTIREEQLEAIKEAAKKLELRGLRFQIDRRKISEFMLAGETRATTDQKK